MSAIEFYFDADNQKRWRVKNEGNHKIVGAATEGYHNLGEAADNLIEIVQTVLQETLAGRFEQRHIDDYQQEIRAGVLRIAGRGIPIETAEQTDFGYLSKEPKGFA